MGTQTAGLIGAGSPFGALAEEYNGTSWSEQNDLNTGRQNVAGAGTQTAGLLFGGQSDGTTVNTQTEAYDGTSWTEVGDLSTARLGLGGFGIQTAAVAATGDDGSNKLGNVEEYNGTAWTEVNNVNGPDRQNLGSAGTLTDGLIFAGNGGGLVAGTEGYDGTSWSTRPSMATARQAPQYGVVGTATATFAAGGETPPVVATTEEFTGDTQAASAKTIDFD